MKSGIEKLVDKLPKLKVSLEKIARKDVLVGVPQETSRREGPVNNATLAYVHDNGSPAQNIPARPFMKPGVETAKPKIIKEFKAAVSDTLKTQEVTVDPHLTRAGLLAVNAIKNKINTGLAPALKPSTVKNRYRSRSTSSRRKGEKAYLQMIGQGVTAAAAQAATGIKPLVNTGSLRDAITFILRGK